MYPWRCEYFMKNKQVWGDSQSEIDRFQNLYKASGWKGVLAAELDLMRSQDPKGKYSTRKVYIAELASQLGDKDLASHYLEEGFQFRLVSFSYLKVDSLLDPLREDPRYAELLSRTQL